MKYFLIRPKSSESSIFADINFRSFRKRISTNIVINTKNWNEKSETVTSKELNYSLSNARLKQIRATVDSLIANYKIKNEKPTEEEFTKQINLIFGIEEEKLPIENEVEITKEDVKSKEILYFGEMFKDWITNREKSGRYAKGHIKRSITTFNLFSHFESKKKNKYLLEDIDLKFYDNFIKYMQIERNMVDSSIGAAFKPLKTFLNYLKENTKFVVSTDLTKFKVFRDDNPPTFAFEDNEIMAIEKLNLEDENLIRTRDLFFVQLHTLQRISDLFQFSKEHIDLKNRTIKITQIKGIEPILLPLSQKNLEIFQKYNFKLPRFSESEDKNRQTYNENLKILFELAGIDYTIEIVRKQGGGRNVQYKKKYEIASSHMIRRTAITYLLKQGVTPEKVMKVSGHKDMATFQRYVKMSKNEAVDDVRNVWNKGK